MNNVFPATLENGVVTWGPNGAPPLPANEPRQVDAFVTAPRPAVDPNDKRTMRELFEELARMDPFRDIDDPVKYIRKLRQDCPRECCQ